MSEPAVRADMPQAEYHAAPGLSHSGMKDLAVSPLRYWHLHINPERVPDEPTREMDLGSALHCAVLEPDGFDKRYARKLEADEIDGCLATIDDIREWIRSKGETPKGTIKAKVIAQAVEIDAHVPIFDVLAREHAQTHAGKVILKRGDFRCVAGCAVALRLEPSIQKILDEGSAEVSVFANDPGTGVLLKARMDWVSPTTILDLKTFSQMRGKSIDKSVTDALYYENYLRQGYFYSLLDSLATGANRTVIFAFVESDEPHEVRIRRLDPKVGGNASVYWVRSQLEVRGLIRTFVEYSKQFGSDPWRYAQPVNPLLDEEIPQLAY